MSKPPIPSDVLDECKRINGSLTDADRIIISAGKAGKPGGWIVEAMAAPEEFFLKSLRVAIKIANQYLARRNGSSVPVPASSGLTPAQRESALRAAFVEVRKLTTDDKVAQTAKDTLQHISGNDVLTSEVAALLASGLPKDQRQGLALFAVDNHGVELAVQHERALAYRKAEQRRDAETARQLKAESQKQAAGIVQARAAEAVRLAKLNGPLKVNRNPVREVVVDVPVTAAEAEEQRKLFIFLLKASGHYDLFLDWLDREPWRKEKMGLVLAEFEGKATPAIAHQLCSLMVAKGYLDLFNEQVLAVSS